MYTAATLAVLIISSITPSYVNSRALSNPLYGYTAQHSSPLPVILAEFLKESKPLPGGLMTSSESTINLLMGLLRVMKAERVLDVGTYAGFSALAMAIALPSNGKVVTMDINDQAWNLVGKKYARKANVSGKIDARVTTPADVTLSELIRKDQSGQFDLCYIDADKMNYELYYEKCLKLIKPLGIIAMDNVLWSDLVTRENFAAMDPITRNFVNLNAKVAADQRVWANLIAIGDGLSICIKKP